jgi:hypothetical protein
MILTAGWRFVNYLGMACKAGYEQQVSNYVLHEKMILLLKALPQA